MQKDEAQQKTTAIGPKTISQLADVMKVSVGTARTYMENIGMGKPSNGGNFYSPKEVETALVKLGYI